MCKVNNRMLAGFLYIWSLQEKSKVSTSHWTIISKFPPTRFDDMFLVDRLCMLLLWVNFEQVGGVGMERAQVGYLRSRELEPNRAKAV
jgi:hypothetical protein